MYTKNVASKGHGHLVQEIKSGVQYVDRLGADESNDHGFYASNVVSTDSYGSHAYAPAVYANAPVEYANAANNAYAHNVKPIAHDIVGNYAPAVYAKDSAAYYVNGDESYAHVGDNSYVHGYDDGHGSYDGRYRFSGRYSPVTAGHYIGYGNKYDFRQGYPYGYGEMLSYTAPVG